MSHNKLKEDFHYLKSESADVLLHIPSSSTFRKKALFIQ